MMYLSILFYNIWYQGQKVIKMYVYIQFYDFGTCKIWECSHFSKKNERNSNVFRIARERSTKQSVGIIVDNTKVKRSKNVCLHTFIWLWDLQNMRKDKRIYYESRDRILDIIIIEEKEYHYIKVTKYIIIYKKWYK